MSRIWFPLTVLGITIGFAVYVECRAADEAQPPSSKVAPDESNELKPLNKSKTVLLDAKGKRLLLQSEVVLREGLLEMLVCLKQSKEHESILSVDTQAKIVHAGLLALGAKPGSPVRWQPEFQSATGQQIDIFFTWVDEDGKLHRDPAQSWVRHATRRYFIEKLEKMPDSFKLPEDSELKWDTKHKELLWYGQMTETQRQDLRKLSDNQDFQAAIDSIFKQSQTRKMIAKWVFAGSYFVTDEKTGETFYQAESGDLICVANFATATLDLSANSSATNDDLMFEAYTENVPPIGTKVTIELIPVFSSDEKAAKPSK